ncbi:MAG: LacI family DNA-binding transcriptional regulator [Trueperaceae bacterium]
MASRSTNARVSSRSTIGDVALAAGVSTGTVSRVLNDRAGVHPATREMVLATIERLGYRPDAVARTLSFRQPTRIGLNVGAGSRRLTPFFMLFLESLIGELSSDGYLLEEIANGPDGLPERLADAFVLFGAHDDDIRLSYLSELGVPFVLLGHAEGVRWVMPDDRDGGHQATSHLLRLGHERIVHLSGLMHNQAFLDRHEGYRAAMRDAGAPLAPELLVDGDFSSLGAYRAVRRALAADIGFSAVFAASDEMAVGAIAALQDCGLKVPLDVSVVGFDDLPEIGEALTTVRQDIPRLATVTVALLKEAVAGKQPANAIVPVQLIARGTTARRR